MLWVSSNIFISQILHFYNVSQSECPFYPLCTETKNRLNKATISRKSWHSHTLRVIVKCAGASLPLTVLDKALIWQSGAQRGQREIAYPCVCVCVPVLSDDPSLYPAKPCNMGAGNCSTLPSVVTMTQHNMVHTMKAIYCQSTFKKFQGHSQLCGWTPQDKPVCSLQISNAPQLLFITLQSPCLFILY